MNNNKAKREDCLDLDLDECLEALLEIVDDPAQILGDKRRRDNRVRATNTDYTDAQQEAICSSFRSVSCSLPLPHSVSSPR